MSDNSANHCDSFGISRVALAIQSLAKRPLLVGIDGLSGAGKTHLANGLQERMPDLAIVRHDDFYRPMEETARQCLNAEQGYQQYFDWQRVEQQVLHPLSLNQAASYQRYDWLKGEVTEAVAIVDTTSIVVVEGVYVTRPELRNYYDLRIWVETSAQERWRRQVARGENSREWIERWAAAESYYIDLIAPSQSAHLVVSGE
jgi:uridine kinase